MGSKIKFFEKNYLDIDNDNASITVTDTTNVDTDDGQEFVNNLRDRKNTSSWSTINSDTNGTTVIDCVLQDYREVDSIILIKNNFEDFTIEYNDGINFNVYNTTTGNTKQNLLLELDNVLTNRVRITITKSRDDAFTGISEGDRYLFQLIITKKASEQELDSYPIIKNATTKNINRVNTSLSGKAIPVFKEPTFSVDLSLKAFTSQNDFTFFDNLHNLRRSYLISLSGFDESQFSMLLRGYRDEDIKLVRMVNDLTNEFYKSIYTSGASLKLKLEESLD